MITLEERYRPHTEIGEILDAAILEPDYAGTTAGTVNRVLEGLRVHGWHRPWPLEDEMELDAWGVGAVVIDKDGTAWQATDYRDGLRVTWKNGIRYLSSRQLLRHSKRVHLIFVPAQETDPVTAEFSGLSDDELRAIRLLHTSAIERGEDALDAAVIVKKITAELSRRAQGV